MVVCVDDVIIASKINEDIQSLLHSLKNGTDMDTKKERLELKNFDLIDDRNINTFLGMIVEQTSLGFHLLQPRLISRILEAVKLIMQENSGRNTKHIHATKSLLIKDTNGEPRSLPWNYRSVIGMMNYLSGSTHPGI